MLVIKDANIFIDLYKMDLIQFLFYTDMDINITDFVAETEITDPEQQELLNSLIEKNQIKVLTSSNKEIIEIIEISNQESNRLSIQDCSNLYFAKKMSAILLTNDGLLRKTARRHKVNVHGILWLFDVWVRNHIMPPDFAAEKLLLLWKVNTWLPYEEIRKRIQTWSKGRLVI